MATQITTVDTKKVIRILVDKLGENYGSRSNPAEYLTRDNWGVLVGGWHREAGWSRGFMVWDNTRNNRGYFSPKHDGGRYEGRGWHQRMADDIIETIQNFRLKVQVTPTPA